MRDISSPTRPILVVRAQPTAELIPVQKQAAGIFTEPVGNRLDHAVGDDDPFAGRLLGFVRRLSLSGLLAPFPDL